MERIERREIFWIRSDQTYLEEGCCCLTLLADIRVIGGGGGGLGACDGQAGGGNIVHRTILTDAMSR